MINEPTCNRLVQSGITKLSTPQKNLYTKGETPRSRRCSLSWPSLVLSAIPSHVLVEELERRGSQLLLTGSPRADDNEPHVKRSRVSSQDISDRFPTGSSSKLGEGLWRVPLSVRTFMENKHKIVRSEDFSHVYYLMIKAHFKKKPYGYWYDDADHLVTTLPEDQATFCFMTTSDLGVRRMTHRRAILPSPPVKRGNVASGRYPIELLQTYVECIAEFLEGHNNLESYLRGNIPLIEEVRHSDGTVEGFYLTQVARDGVEEIRVPINPPFVSSAAATLLIAVGMRWWRELNAGRMLPKEVHGDLSKTKRNNILLRVKPCGSSNYVIPSHTDKVMESESWVVEWNEEYPVDPKQVSVEFPMDVLDIAEAKKTAEMLRAYLVFLGGRLHPRDELSDRKALEIPVLPCICKAESVAWDPGMALFRCDHYFLPWCIQDAVLGYHPVHEWMAARSLESMCIDYTASRGFWIRQETAVAGATPAVEVVNSANKVYPLYIEYYGDRKKALHGGRRLVEFCNSCLLSPPKQWSSATSCSIASGPMEINFDFVRPYSGVVFLMKQLRRPGPYEPINWRVFAPTSRICVYKKEDDAFTLTLVTIPPWKPPKGKATMVRSKGGRNEPSAETPLRARKRMRASVQHWERPLLEYLRSGLPCVVEVEKTETTPYFLEERSFSGWEVFWWSRNLEYVKRFPSDQTSSAISFARELKMRREKFGTRVQSPNELPENLSADQTSASCSPDVRSSPHAPAAYRVHSEKRSRHCAGAFSRTDSFAHSSSSSAVEEAADRNQMQGVCQESNGRYEEETHSSPGSPLEMALEEVSDEPETRSECDPSEPQQSHEFPSSLLLDSPGATVPAEDYANTEFSQNPPLDVIPEPLSAAGAHRKQFLQWMQTIRERKKHASSAGINERQGITSENVDGSHDEYLTEEPTSVTVEGSETNLDSDSIGAREAPPLVIPVRTPPPEYLNTVVLDMAQGQGKRVNMNEPDGKSGKTKRYVCFRVSRYGNIATASREARAFAFVRWLCRQDPVGLGDTALLAAVKHIKGGGFLLPSHEQPNSKSSDSILATEQLTPRDFEATNALLQQLLVRRDVKTEGTPVEHKQVTVITHPPPAPQEKPRGSRPPVSIDRHGVEQAARPVNLDLRGVQQAAAPTSGTPMRWNMLSAVNGSFPMSPQRADVEGSAVEKQIPISEPKRKSVERSIVIDIEDSSSGDVD